MSLWTLHADSLGKITAFFYIEVSCSKLARNVQESTTEKLLAAGSSSLEDGTSRGKRKLDETSEPTEAVSGEYRVHTYWFDLCLP